MSLLTRLSWHAYRTPAIRPVKAVMRALAGADIQTRRTLARELGEQEATNRLGDTLNEQGYAVVTDALDRALIAELGAAGDRKLGRVAEATERQRMRHKAFWVRLLDEDMVDGVLPTDNPFVKFALQPAVLRILARSLGELPQLDYVLLTLSKANDAPLTQSQLWHRDYDDLRTIKLFAYLTDVNDTADGPFTFIPGPSSDRIGFSLKSHRPDEKVFRGAVRESDKVEMIAPKLSAFMVETSRCLHMGSRLTDDRHRLLYTATFIMAPRLYREPPPAFQPRGSETEFERCVLDRVVTTRSKR